MHVTVAVIMPSASSQLACVVCAMRAWGPANDFDDDGAPTAFGADNTDDAFAEAGDDYYGANPAVSCLDADGQGDDPFIWTGCSQLKCNDISGDGATTSDPFTQGTGDGSPGTCSTGMTIKTSLAVGCADPAGCTTNDCCTDDDGCAPALGLNGVDDSGGGS